MKIALIADLHYSKTRNAMLPERAGHFADTFLLRTVHRLNRAIKPDLVVIAGDLINDPQDATAKELLAELGNIIGLLQMPAIVIPGNHDPDPEVFYRHFPRPPEFIDCGGVRIVPFLDAEAPGYNAVRSQADIDRLKTLSTFDGPLISIQHVPLFPPGATGCPYNCTNATEIFAALPEDRRFITLSGHFHQGFTAVNTDSTTAICAPALCEKPFRFEIIEISPAGTVSQETHSLKLPVPGLTDLHVHTPLAYCSENMNIATTLELAELFGLQKIAFSEHSSHLYFEKDRAHQGAYDNESFSDSNIDRASEYFTVLKPYRQTGRFYTGFELDIDKNGKPVISPEVLRQADFTLGAVHYLENKQDYEAAKAEFIFKTRALASSGIKVLAHPFRAFRRSKLPCPAELFAVVVAILKQYGVAAEINYHTNDPEPEFFDLCIRQGVKIALGSDSHNLYEVGELSPHLNFLKKLGVYEQREELLYYGPVLNYTIEK